MELFQLRYFLEVAKHENMSKAAEVLLISQPSISKAILSLEMELGVKLFDRRGKRIQLNEVGKVLRDRLTPIIRALENIHLDLQVISGAKKSLILLKVLAASSLLPDILQKFKNKHPYIDFQISQQQQSNRYDLCICATSPNFYFSNGLLLLSEEILLAVPADSPWKYYDSIELYELRDERFIMLNNNLPLRAITDQFFKTCGYSPDVAFESDNPNTIRDLVSSGLGISMWPEVSWGKIFSEKAKLIHIKNPVCRRNIFVTWQQDAVLNEQAQLFLYFLKDYFKLLLQCSLQ